MNKEEILNRVIQKSICINAGGKGCYSPYTNDIDWFSDIDNLILMYEQLQQENKQLKDKLSKIETLIINHNCDTGDIYYKYNSKFLKSELKQRILEIVYKEGSD